jgi:alpha-glucosidase (family GH31 glycosyl hydrolase)
VNRTWGGLQSQPEIALQMGMQGLAYMHSDLGGFAGDNLDDELYARWLQYGVFQPIYRPHAQEGVASEPVYRSEKAQALAKEAIELRYRLTPYNYNLMFENNQTGAPLMRPLFFEDEINTELFDYSDAYLWGKDILVAPILKAGQTTKDVYFPKHSNWFDFYSTTTYQGGSVTAYKLEENTIPTFVRGGAFIPMTNTVNSLKLYDSNNLVVHYYYDDSISQSKRKIYNDDGTTVNAFEKEAYEILEFEAELKGRQLEIEIEAEIGENYNINNKTIQLIIHNMTSSPKRIKVDGKKIEGNWNSKKQTITIPLTWNTSEDKEIKIKLNK